MRKETLARLPHMIGVLMLLANGELAARAQPAAMVADIQAPEATLFPLTWPGFYALTDFVAINGVVVMALDDGVHGVELWVSDGTAAGSHLLRDLCPGPCAGRPYGFTLFGGFVYFAAVDGAHGAELWRTDGTLPGTSLVADLVPGLGGSDPWSFAAIHGLLWFSARRGDGVAFWRTDGTVAGTWPVTDASPDLTAWESIVVLGALPSARVLFAFADTAHGLEPWVSDGTVAGTSLAADIAPGPNGSLEPDQPFRGVSTPVQAGGRAIFAADDGVHGGEPWASDGTAAGTFILADVEPGAASSALARFRELAGRAYFAASHTGAARELWTTDGTAAGTAPLFGTVQPALTSGYWNVSEFRNGLLFDGAATGFGSELWWSDGTDAGTAMVKDLWPGPESGANLYNFGGTFSVGDRAFFLADDGVHGVEPWSTDGTEAGTEMLANASVDGPEPGGFQLDNYLYGLLDRPALLGNRLIFRLFRDFRSNELWSTDGTPAGTQRLVVVGAGGSSLSSQIQMTRLVNPRLGAAGTTAVLAADDGATGPELWVSDGSAAGTHLLADLDPSAVSGGANPQQFISVGARSLFSYTVYDEGTAQYASWLGVTDGTVAGTTSLAAGGWIESAVS